MRNNQTITVPAGDGVITGTLWEPDGEPEAALVIHAATATPQGFYRNLAGYLAENGIATITYDYRGTGRSGSPRAHRHLAMRDWMETDVPAVAAWAHERFPGLPQFAIGHSLGGHALTLGHGTGRLTAFALVASHVVSIREIPDRAERLRVSLVMKVLGPALGRMLGYVPARRLGLGEDIPAAAMAQWAAWSQQEGYLFTDPAMRGPERAATVTLPVLIIGLTDDKWATASQIDGLAAHLANATVERRTYSPADAGVTEIGHHGFMRRHVKDALWPDLLGWLRRHAGSSVR
ncbi:alpha/beta fold hydrolase [Actinoplanes sp. NBRC 101535]|uniref:alpha/beta hydrolase family protein n=1 Tax=Actinoplanes sp. NBRC 101535 TaxID=3032196 RepID=UPI00249FA535|nr:alpha/beta fold hydrolase [Actinoplanes sp. NBRC 101535]GLX99857.1 alpha/beta hydrolase [Actinoplanes sp. NBRC 101535]